MNGTPILDVVSRSHVDADEVVPPLPGFIVSEFPSLLWIAATRCLVQAGFPPSISGDGDVDRVGILLCSRMLDSTTLALAAEQTKAGTLSPILFYQAVPTAVLGLIARDHALTGPVSCIAAEADAAEEARYVAAVTLGDGDADALLLLTIELEAAAPGPRATAELVRLRGDDDRIEYAR